MFVSKSFIDSQVVLQELMNLLTYFPVEGLPVDDFCCQTVCGRVVVQVDRLWELVLTQLRHQH